MPSLILSGHRELVRQTPNFVAPREVDGVCLVISMIENAAVLSTIPSIPHASLPSNYIALRAVLKQMCGNAVQKLPKEFTSRYPALSKLCFADGTVGAARGKAWFTDERDIVAHALNLKAFLALYASYIDQHERAIQELAATAKRCLNPELREQVAGTSKEKAVPAASITLAGVKESDFPSSTHPGAMRYLTNIIDAFETMQQIVGSGAEAFNVSLPDQALVLLTVQIAGNNLKRLKDIGIVIPGTQVLIDGRDDFAHANALSEQCENPSRLWYSYAVRSNALKTIIIAARDKLKPPAGAIQDDASDDSDNDSHGTISPARPSVTTPTAAVSISTPEASDEKNEAKEERGPESTVFAPTPIAQVASIDHGKEKLISAFQRVSNLFFPHQDIQDPKEALKEVAASLDRHLLNETITFTLNTSKTTDKTSHYEYNGRCVPFRPTKTPTDKITLSLLGYILLATDQIALLQILLEIGVNPNTTIHLHQTGVEYPCYPRPLLHILVEQANLSRVQLFLRHGANPNTVDTKGLHALDLIREGSFDVLATLLRHGADPLMVTTLTFPDGDKARVPVFVRFLVNPLLTDAFRLRGLRLFTKHICQRSGVYRMKPLFTTVVYKDDGETATLAKVISAQNEKFDTKAAVREEISYRHPPLKCKDFLQKIYAILEAKDPLRLAIMEGQIERVQSILATQTHLTLDVLTDATLFAELMEYPEIAAEVRIAIENKGPIFRAILSGQVEAVQKAIVEVAYASLPQIMQFASKMGHGSASPISACILGYARAARSSTPAADTRSSSTTSSSSYSSRSTLLLSPETGALSTGLAIAVSAPAKDSYVSSSDYARRSTDNASGVNTASMVGASSTSAAASAPVSR